MRQRFEQQLNVFITPISEVKLPLKSRDELPPVLRALQYIFITPELNEKVFQLLENKICSGKKKTGRPGMDLWHVLVLAVIRQALDTNWDRLCLMANADKYTRNIMGVIALTDEDDFEYQTILDNVSLIDEGLLLSINNLVVEAGHTLAKKKDEEALKLKTDSYALETNVHFPTDLNLLWDSSRKCIDTAAKLIPLIELSGWRKIQSIRKTVKSKFRETSHHVFKGKTEKVKEQKVKEYLHLTLELNLKCKAILNNKIIIKNPRNEKKVIQRLVELKKYADFAAKFMNQIERRLLKKESIPANEKLYSIFEEHTEWITKGKLNKRVELGHLLLITTDQYQYIVDYKIMEGEKDASQIVTLVERIEQKFANRKIHSQSFDKGFFSNENSQILEKSKVENPILPKRGKLTLKDKERESSKEFKNLRNQHSAIESNINMLEHHGLNRCRDKGIHGFNRCVGLSVLAYNLHIMGNQLMAIERAIEKELRKISFKKVA